ncbi:MAG: hypothetical protein GX803_02320 [Lentisphaerae bacterium]|nr:hypothetical protein [Lentisphaerota bacterium]
MFAALLDDMISALATDSRRHGHLAIAPVETGFADRTEQIVLPERTLELPN